MGLDEVADELYGLDPDDFMAARTTAAASAKAAGDKAAATAIGKLRRPTRSAWAVNLLCRNANDQLTELMELGDALTAAHESLSGPELRRLSTQRNQVVNTVARRAAALAKDRDRPLTEATRTEVASTLQAAIADPEVRELVVAGRVDKARSYSGFGLGLGTGTPARPAEPSAPPTPAKKKRPATDDDPEAEQAELLRAVEAAQTDVAGAEQTVEAAAEQVEQAATALTEATERVDSASQEVADLRAELRRAEEAETEARRAVTEVADGHHDATTAHAEAVSALTEVQRTLRDLLAR